MVVSRAIIWTFTGSYSYHMSQEIRSPVNQTPCNVLRQRFCPEYGAQQYERLALFGNRACHSGSSTVNRNQVLLGLRQQGFVQRTGQADLRCGGESLSKRVSRRGAEDAEIAEDNHVHPKNPSSDNLLHIHHLDLVDQRSIRRNSTTR